MQSNCNPIRSKPPKRIQPTSLQRVPRQRRVSTLTSCLSTASFYADLHHGRGLVSGEGVWTGAYWHCDKANWRKCRMPSPEPPLRDGAAVRWSRFKIATNVGSGVTCSPPSHVSPLVRLKIGRASCRERE